MNETTLKKKTGDTGVSVATGGAILGRFPRARSRPRVDQSRRAPASRAAFDWSKWKAIWGSSDWFFPPTPWTACLEGSILPVTSLVTFRLLLPDTLTKYQFRLGYS